MKQIKFILPAFIAAGGLVLTSSMSFAKPEYTKTEKKGCVYCHVSAKTKELNDVGKCYKDNDHSLKTCAAKK